MFFGNQAPCVPTVQRRGKFLSDNGVYQYHSFPIAAPSDFIQKIMSRYSAPYAGNGAAATNTYINNTLEVELPFYMNKRFASPRIISAQNLDCNSHTVSSQAFEVGTTDAIVNHPYQQFDAVAEDWTLFFFTGVPRYYKYTVDQESSS